jgi:Kyakuja-Dileera-Zisupton transposase
LFKSDYFLVQEDVNKFANEVEHKAPAKDPNKDITADNAPETVQLDSEGNSIDGAQPGITVACVNNWKASQADEVQCMWNIYEETGALLQHVNMV